MTVFDCIFDFMSELRPWIAPTPKAASAMDLAAAASQPSLADLWMLRRLGLSCSRALGMWIAEDPESMPQKFTESLPALLALNARSEVKTRRARCPWSGRIIQVHMVAFLTAVLGLQVCLLSARRVTAGRLSIFVSFLCACREEEATPTRRQVRDAYAHFAAIM